MIFVTLGSQRFQFNRLLQKVDQLVSENIITEEVYAQIGYSDYLPQYYNFKKFLNRDEYNDLEKKADIVITHGGTGAIIGAVKKGKKVIAIPRLSKFREHVDDHQIQLLKEFDEMGIIEVCYEIENMKEAYDKLKITNYKGYVSNTEQIIESIELFLSGEEKK